jgi:hypothetical protein
LCAMTGCEVFPRSNQDFYGFLSLICRVARDALDYGVLLHCK